MSTINSTFGRARRLVALVSWTALAAGGCSSASSPAEVRLRSLENDNLLAQRFPAASVQTTASGDYHVVLVNDGVQQSLRRTEPGEPLQPVDLLPVQQIVHIHVFWRPMRGAKPDNPSATNAAIDWYFVGTGDQGPTDVLHYQGAGFVTVRGAQGEEAAVNIRSGTLRLANATQGMRDPFDGAARVAGKFLADPDPASVRHVLDRIDHLSAIPATRPANAAEEQ